MGNEAHDGAESAATGPGRVNSSLRDSLWESGRAEFHYTVDLAKALWATLKEEPSSAAANPVRPDPKDWRFAHPIWSTNRYFHLLEQNHLLMQRCAVEIAESLPISPRDRRAFRGLTQFVVDAIAPTNFLAGNPAALQAVLDTRGRSLLAGARNLLSDISAKHKLPPLTDLRKFDKGMDLAASEGSVIHRNRIVEVIQYKARTQTAYATPLLIVPPWVNRHYIADIAPGKSFVEWMVERGHTVFSMSYRNADASLADVGFDTYMKEGLIPALDAVQDITGAEKVNLVGPCLGGTLALMMAAWEADQKHQRVASVTLMNSLIDFSDFSDMLHSPNRERVAEFTFQLIDRLWRYKGYVDGYTIGNFFRLLRANELVWPQVITNWLLGKESPEHPVLAWSSDSTHVPYRAQRYLVHELVMKNSLARGEACIDGKRLHLQDVTQDIFISAARDDHIIPWTAAYRTAALLPGDVRFHLVSGGHVLGSATPPSPGKARYWTADHRLYQGSSDWLAHAVEHRASWWSAWEEWLSRRAGERCNPPSMGNSRYPVIGKAPGTYVFT
ncbi:alpha/beta fold hydrolase [Streptomyces sp. b94]|uniref:PHA/PHB synthase family protein n=1 Tax=Streptomyces sp. b94 TaxID=1827634 RepID=UPI001B36D63F|nr:alpha/beta fold hydrolase [Streptomyces sp. b94]MBQ1095491.1 alpha/beta fold hydrolase [Streptomyces sp. b94]